MKLADLRKPLDQMSDTEILEAIREIRHRRNVERPAAAQRKERAERKETRSKTSKLQSKLEKALAGMTEAERADFLKILGGEQGGSEQAEGNQT